MSFIFSVFLLYLLIRFDIILILSPSHRRSRLISIFLMLVARALDSIDVHCCSAFIYLFRVWQTVWFGFIPMRTICGGEKIDRIESDQKWHDQNNRKAFLFIYMSTSRKEKKTPWFIKWKRKSTIELHPNIEEL